MKKQGGFTLIELLIVVAIAIPNLLRSKMAANESSAIASMRTINTAEVTYATAHPNAGYSANVASLGEVPATCAATATSATACLINNTLANATGAGILPVNVLGVGTDLLHKPFTQVELNEKIRRLLCLTPR